MKLVLTLGLLLFTHILFATSLFDKNRGQQPAAPKTPNRPAVHRPAPTINFKLIGLSQFSNLYKLSFLNTKKNKVQMIEWQADNEHIDSPLAGFHIAQIKERTVVLKPNADQPYKCKKNNLNFVSCVQDKQEIVFQLAVNAAIKMKRPGIKKVNNAIPKAPTSAKNPTTLRNNPFQVH